jgi:hypothetical protein
MRRYTRIKKLARSFRNLIAFEGAELDLPEGGHVVKEKDGRRNRYHIQAHLPLPEPNGRERAIGEILALLAGPGATEAWAGEPPVRLER